MFNLTAIVLARALHVMAGVIWAGSAVIFAAAIAPVLSRHAAEGAGRWVGMVARRAAMISGISVVLTVLSGIYLFAALHAHDETASGWVLKTGAVAALLAMAVGLLVGRPAGIKLAKAQESQTNGAISDEAARQLGVLRGRAVLSSRVALGLLGVSVVAMATFRYAQALAG